MPARVWAGRGPPGRVRGVVILQKHIRAVGNRAKATIEARTQRGIGVNGTRFKSKEDGKPSTLRDTGALIKSLRVRVKGHRATVEATAPYAEYVNQERPFMGLSEQEQRAEAAVLESEIEEMLRQRLLRMMG